MRGKSATISLRIAMGHIHVRLLSVPATDTTADLRAAGSRRSVIVAASKGVRLTTTARATAARLTTATSARRTIVPSGGHMCSGLAAGGSATVKVATTCSATRPVIADSGSTVPLYACSTTRPVIANSRATMALYARSATRSVTARSRATVTLYACSATRPIVMHGGRCPMPLSAADTGRPIVTARRARRLTTGAPVVLRPTATTRATPHLSAARSPSRPIIVAGHMIRPTTLRPTTLRSAVLRAAAVSMHVGAASRATVIIARTTLRTMSCHTVLTTAAPLTSARSLDTMAGKQARPLSRSNTGSALVDRGTQIVVTECRVLMIPLHRSERNVPIVLCSQLVRARPCAHAAFTAVEAHASHIVIVDNRLVVNVGNVHATEVGNGSVVVKRVATPVTALKTNTTVTVPVVDTTVETYVRTPIALVPYIEAVTPAPITGSP